METRHVAVGIIKNAAGQVLIALRPEAVDQGGLWEFPGGKVEAGETAEAALLRELKEELGIAVLAAAPLITVTHRYPGLAVRLSVFLVGRFEGEAMGVEGQRLTWARPDELPQYPFPAANGPIVTAARLPRHYAILDGADAPLLLDNLEKALGKGVRLVQARLKGLPANSVGAFVGQAHPLCRQHGALLLMNSAVGNAGAFAVDGLHLTSRDLMAAVGRPQLPAGRWLAASCHDLRELRHAQRIGVDFAVLAPVLPTKTHPGARPIGWRQFALWVAQANLPVYALGGLAEADLDNAIRAGAQGIAAIRAFRGG